MKKRIFGKTGAEVSEVGLGCWQLGGADWGDVSDEKALGILAAAVEAGVTFFVRPASMKWSRKPNRTL
jgi:aryl-alcohol dehydrogenase-like predicted oxidoreductase